MEICNEPFASEDLFKLNCYAVSEEVLDAGDIHSHHNQFPLPKFDTAERPRLAAVLPLAFYVFVLALFLRFRVYVLFRPFCVRAFDVTRPLHNHVFDVTWPLHVHACDITQPLCAPNLAVFQHAKPLKALLAHL